VISEADQTPVFQEIEPNPTPTTLIVACGHLALKDDYNLGYKLDLEELSVSPDEFNLRPYQDMVEIGQVFAQIDNLIEILRCDKDGRVAVCFSGYDRGMPDGHTEGDSYQSIARTMISLKDGIDVDLARKIEARSIVDPYADRTGLNCLYAICRFFEEYGYYPKRFEMATWGMKRGRSIHYMTDVFKFKDWWGIYVNDPLYDLPRARVSELRVLNKAKKDPFALGRTFHEDSRKARAGQGIQVPERYKRSNPELSPIFDYLESPGSIDPDYGMNEFGVPIHLKWPWENEQIELEEARHEAQRLEAERQIQQNP